MDIKRLKTLAGVLKESVDVNEGVRDATNRVHDAMDEGILDPRAVADAALSYMSEDEVADMAHANEFFPDDYSDEEDFDDEDDDYDFDSQDALDAGETEYDRRNDLRGGW